MTLDQPTKKTANTERRLIDSMAKAICRQSIMGQENPTLLCEKNRPCDKHVMCMKLANKTLDFSRKLASTC
ncbi:MAG: hypothetical protein ACTSV1_03430 [Alphaproteobacteria bacterium]